MTVDLPYDNRASGPPWEFAGWTDTGEVTTNTHAGEQRAWSKTCPAGTVAMPGNRPGGDTHAQSMYGVAVKPV
ncbi:MAG: hypothetical protein GVY24_03015 [Planctomycetes bacterium]|jgi:hypothetical protein|nr:hypothetical protein [Planctomycetota bacterium]